MNAILRILLDLVDKNPEVLPSMIRLFQAVAKAPDKLAAIRAAETAAFKAYVRS